MENYVEKCFLVMDLLGEMGVEKFCGGGRTQKYGDNWGDVGDKLAILGIFKSVCG